MEGSLARLQTDHIDLYYQHRIDPKVSPEEVVSRMKDLIKEGKIRAWGISEINENYLRRANKICHISAIQNRYSLMARGYEHMFKACEELGVTYVAFSPLANGFLSGKEAKIEKEGDYRNFMPQYTKRI